MAKVSAETFSLAGDKYLETSYDTMDCQAFYEQCAADAGWLKDLKGSNAWYREFIRNGWVGTPEDCKKIFGSIPNGATLFIHAYDGGEEKRGYHDGLGNASHIGIKTGRGKGAIHSSYTRQCVAESEFRDKTVRGGGWNTVGLHEQFSYGEAIDRKLETVRGNGSNGSNKNNENNGNNKSNGSNRNNGNKGQHGQEENRVYSAILEGGKTGSPINIRKSENGDLQEKLPQGSRVTVLSESRDWCLIEYRKGGKTLTGYVKGEFVTVAEDSGDPSDASGGEEPWGSEMVTISFSMTAREVSDALPLLEKLVGAIVDKVGRG